MSDDSSNFNSDSPQPSSTSNDASLGLSSAYETNHPPEMELPPPSTEKLELEELSPKDISVKEAEEQNDTTKAPPKPPFGEFPSASGMPANWKPNKIMRRADWGSAKPKWIEGLEIPVDKVVVSFTETDPCYTEEECQKFVRNLQKEHMAEENVPDIKHNFLIGGDEVIYEGRGYMRLGPTYKPSPKKIEELNGKSIDIAIIERSVTKPSKGTIAAISYFLATAVNENCLAKNFFTYYVIDGEIDNIQPSIQQEQLSL